jgi:uncharacterized protein YebE (UPF0316 family)
MDAFLSPQVWLLALGIFALRVADMALDTIRVLFVVRGRKKLAWVLGFFQSLLFVIAISQVLVNLTNILSVAAWAAGFATGNVVGMIIEERMAIGHIEFTIISSTRGAAVAEELRKNGYAVTEISARGRGGMVTVLQVNVLRKDMDNIETIVLEADPEAFVTANEVRPIRRGYWRA